MRYLPMVLLLVPRLAWADPPVVQPIPPGNDVIVSVSKGQQAPFSGQLFDQDTSLRWANYLQQYRLRMALDIEHQKQLCAADSDFYKKKIDAQQAEYKAVTDDLQKRLLEAQKENANPPFYKTPWFGVSVGVVGTVGVLAVTAALLSAVK